MKRAAISVRVSSFAFANKWASAYYVGASQMQGLVPGLFSFYLGTDPQKIEPVKTALAR